MVNTRRGKTPNPLNVLLTNGRFPVSIDLARQLKKAGHHVFVVDPMKYHVCKFSNAVKKSWHVPVPHEDAEGYVRGVRTAIDEAKIDIVIPLHEELFYLAECEDEEILRRLIAPPFDVLIRLHNKWEFTEYLTSLGLDVPKASLCKNMDDVRALDTSRDIALKPVFGRAASNVYHLGPGRPAPTDIDVDATNHYIAQEWLDGARYCSYSVLRAGTVQAFAVYPVQDTLDGSSCVYFKAIEHARIRAYVERVARALGHITGQLAFDFIETSAGRLVAIECNPRATSGIHLFSGTRDLAQVLTSPSRAPSHARPGAQRQVAPGMLMWDRHQYPGLRGYLRHMGRLMGTRDVMFRWSDLVPTLMQPFLLTSYYEICREREMRLADVFQWDVTWEPAGEHLERVRRRVEEVKERERGGGDGAGRGEKVDAPAQVNGNGQGPIQMNGNGLADGHDITEKGLANGDAAAHDRTTDEKGAAAHTNRLSPTDARSPETLAH